MGLFVPVASKPLDAPIAVGTWVQLDAGVTFYDDELIAGGSPWRLLRVPGASSRLVALWRHGGVVEAGHDRFARTLVQQGLLHPTYESHHGANDLDVVIPVFANATGLDRILAKLTDLSVWVVDDGSPNRDEIAAVVARHGARLVRSESNAGPAHARNLGLASTTRPFVWFLDADMDFRDGPIDVTSLLAHFDDELVGAVATRVVGAAGDGPRARFEQRHSPLDMGDHGALVIPGAKVSYVPSASLFLRRAAAGDGFDESLRVGEDVDFVWRLHDAGWLVRYDASRVLTHHARGDWRSWWSQRVRYGQSGSELARRHPDRVVPLRADLFTLAAWSSLLARQPRATAAIVSVARRNLRDQLPATVADRDDVANRIAVRGIAGAGGPLARSVVRHYGPFLLLAIFHPALRKGAVAVFSLGTAWRWRSTRSLRLSDIPLAVADDAAYAVGVWQGAWRARSWRAVRPKVTVSTAGLRSVLVASRRSPLLARRVKGAVERN